MRFQALEKLDNNALQTELLKYKKEYFNLRFQKVLGEIKDTSRIKNVRKNVARVVTAINRIKKG